MERDVIGIAKEGTRCLYYTWIILNKSGRKRNGEGVTQGKCENARSLVRLRYLIWMRKLLVCLWGPHKIWHLCLMRFLLQTSSNGGNTFYDHIAALSHQTFNSLAASIPDSISGRKVLAALIMRQGEEDEGMVISLGTGRMMIVMIFVMVRMIYDNENVCDSDIYNHEDDDNNDGINLLKPPPPKKKKKKKKIIVLV